jgi:hypothetical protein
VETIEEREYTLRCAVSSPGGAIAPSCGLAVARLGFGVVSVCLALLFLAATGEAGQLCLHPSSRSGANLSFDCDGNAFPNDYIGYDSGGGVPCHTRLDVADQCDLGIGRRDDDPPLVYGFSISRSPSDPFVNRGPYEETTVLYLWYVCTREDGLSGAEFSFTGTMTPLEFTPLNGFMNAGTDADLILSATGCPSGPVVVGEILVRDAISPIAHLRWGRIKSRYR